ncbi:MAG: hypothetical protein GC154_16820 [bacterium]|nr:hypothetical protein [bacterium]
MIESGSPSIHTPPNLPSEAGWRRWIALGAEALFLTPVLLVPLLFSKLGTDSATLKEPALQVPVALLLLARPFLLWAERRAAPQSRMITFAFWALLAYLFCSAVLISGHPRAWLEWIRWASYLGAFYLAFSLMNRRERFDRFIGLTVFVSALATLYALSQAAGYEPPFISMDWDTFTPEGSTLHRVGSSLCNPDYLAGYLLGVIPLTLTLAWDSRGLKRFMLAALFIAHLFALFFTYSRGGWAAAFAALGLSVGWMMLRERRVRGLPMRAVLARAAAAGALIVLILGAACGLFFREQAIAFAQRFENLTRDQSVQTRLYYYKGAIDLWRTAPLTGRGLGTYALHFHEVRDKALAEMYPFRRFHVEHAHDEFLQILAETGGFGLALYALLFGCTVFMALRFLRESPRREGAALGLLMGMIAIWTHNLFTVTLRYPPDAWLLWSFAGVLAGAAARRGVPARSRINWTHVTLWMLAPLLAPMILFYSVRFYAGDRLIQSGKDILFTETRNDASRADNREVMEKSLYCFRRAMELSPSRVESYFYSALAYNKALDFDQAQRDYAALQEMQPNFTASLMNLATNQLQMAETLGKPDYFPQGTPPFPMMSVKALEEAIRWAKAGEEDDPYDPVYPHILGRAYFALGRWDEAAAAYQRTIDKGMAASEDMYRLEIADGRSQLVIIDRIKAQVDAKPEQSASGE